MSDRQRRANARRARRDAAEDAQLRRQLNAAQAEIRRLRRERLQGVEAVAAQPAVVDVEEPRHQLEATRTELRQLRQQIQENHEIHGAKIRDGQERIAAELERFLGMFAQQINVLLGRAPGAQEGQAGFLHGYIAGNVAAEYAYNQRLERYVEYVRGPLCEYVDRGAYMAEGYHGLGNSETAEHFAALRWLRVDKGGVGWIGQFGHAGDRGQIGGQTGLDAVLGPVAAAGDAGRVFKLECLNGMSCDGSVKRERLDVESVERLDGPARAANVTRARGTEPRGAGVAVQGAECAAQRDASFDMIKAFWDAHDIRNRIARQNRVGGVAPAAHPWLEQLRAAPTAPGLGGGLMLTQDELDVLSHLYKTLLAAETAAQLAAEGAAVPQPVPAHATGPIKRSARPIARQH